MSKAALQTPSRRRADSAALTPLPAYAQRLLDDPSPIILLWWSRSVLKTTTVARRVVIDRLTGRVTRDAIYTTVNEDNGAEFLRAVKRDLELAGHVSEVLWGTEKIDGVDVRVGYVDFPRIGNARPRVKFIASSPTAWRGLRGDIIIDELGFVTDLDLVLTAAAGCASLGGVMIMMTSGVTEGSVADELVEMGRRRAGMEGAGPVRPGDMPVSLHTVTIDQAIEQGVVEYLRHVTGMSKGRDEWREHCRIMYRTEQSWLEETGCVKRKRSESMYLPPTLTERLQRDDDGVIVTSGPGLLAAVAESVKRHSPTELAAGWDIARKNHLSVLWVWGRCGVRWRTMGVLAMRGVRYDAQSQALRSLMDADFGGRGRLTVKRVCIDNTGMGAPLAEEAETRYRSRAEGVTMTAQTKDVLMPLLRKHVESETITLPMSGEVIADFAQVRSEVTVAGNVRYIADESEIGHADMAWAASLGLHAAESKVSRFQPVRLVGGCRG